MRLRSFGCSFIYGSELADRNNTWPALIAEKLGLPHTNHGIEGAGNLRILESILLHADAGDLCLINWTWIDRFDFMPSTTETWATLRPVLDHEYANYYFRRLHGQYRDMLTNLAYINTAIDFLQLRGTPFVMTVLDRLLFESVQQEWHAPAAVKALQSRVAPCITWFEEKTFLEWAKQQGHSISPTWHPLDTAHQGAATIMMPKIGHILSGPKT